jgi:hypothetical protein
MEPVEGVEGAGVWLQDQTAKATNGNKKNQIFRFINSPFQVKLNAQLYCAYYGCAVIIVFIP